MTLTEEQAIKFYTEKKDHPIITIREFGYLDKDMNFFVINDNYVIRYIIPEAMNPLMRNKNFQPRISGMKITRSDLMYYLTSNKIYSKSYHMV